MNKSEEYIPVLLNINRAEDRESFENLVKRPEVKRVDLIENQIQELILCRNAGLTLEEVHQKGLIREYIEDVGGDLLKIGTWVYYPWNQYLVHVLPEEEFIEVRTNRNREKISTEEQNILRSKKIGIAGLSVGRAVAIAIATERVAGELYLADFDNIELTNLNRIATGLWEIGTNKAIASAREVAEIDPYIKVKCFTEGITPENLPEFLEGDGKLDIFIEECDDLRIKVISRIECRKRGIPVIMETNDRCQVDIERFDLEPDRPIFHGKLTSEMIENPDLLLDENYKMDFSKRIIDITTLSTGMMKSVPLIHNSLRSWPQLFSEVILGASLSCKYARQISLNNHTASGTFIHG